MFERLTHKPYTPDACLSALSLFLQIAIERFSSLQIRWLIDNSLTLFSHSSTHLFSSKVVHVMQTCIRLAFACWYLQYFYSIFFKKLLTTIIKQSSA